MFEKHFSGGLCCLGQPLPLIRLKTVCEEICRVGRVTAAILAEEVPHFCFLPALLPGSRRPDVSSAKALYLWKANLPGCQHKLPDLLCRKTEDEIQSMLLSENTLEGHHTCFKLCVLVDEMRFTALSTAFMILWDMHLNV